MNPDITEILCDAVTHADSDATAIATVMEDLAEALVDVLGAAMISQWETEQEKDQFLALTGHLVRAVSLLNLGTIVLRDGARDHAWALLNAATRPVTELLTARPDTTEPEQATVTYLRLDMLDVPPGTGSRSELAHRSIATVSQITDIRLSRTPAMFLDEEGLDTRYITITWDLITTGLAHIQEHIRDWCEMDDITTIVHAVEQARALRENTFPSAA